MKTSIIKILPLLLLSACARIPEPKIIINPNEFRNQTTASLINNFIETKDGKRIDFQLSETREHNTNSKINLSDKERKLDLTIEVTTSFGTGVVSDSHIHLIVDREIIKLLSSNGTIERTKSFHYQPGIYIGKIYNPGYSYTVNLATEHLNSKLTVEQLRKLILAKVAKVKIETATGYLEGTFNKKSIQSMKKFLKKCIDAKILKLSEEEG